MSHSLLQIPIISWMNIRNIPQRLGTSSVAVFGVACVVGVFIGVLSMATGFQRTMLKGGAEDIAIIMRSGATSEMASGLGYAQAQEISHLPGIVRNGEEPISSPELYVVVDVTKRSTNSSANVPLRGVLSAAFDIRKNLKMVEGRQFTPGTNELVVGRAVQRQFAQLNVGDKIKFGSTEWTVVGAFEAEGGLAESELWCDAKVLQEVYRRGNSFQTVRVKLDGADGMQKLKEGLASNPTFNFSAQLESEYLAEQSKPLTVFIKTIGWPVAILMAIGAIFGAINTMYTSVSTRTREIATLRAIGFGSLPVAISTLVESILLSLVGGLIGAIVVYLLFNGYTVSTLNFSSFSQVVFDFAVTKELIIQGIWFAVIIGFIGGFFPAIRAANLPIATALREV
jgi:putative ABC transport system permease protein